MIISDLGENLYRKQGVYRDSPYLFNGLENWNIGKDEIVERERWDIFLNNRKVENSIWGVRGTRQPHLIIEPNKEWLKSSLKIQRDNFWEDSAFNVYYFYTENSIDYRANELFYSVQCYKPDQYPKSNLFQVVPVFKNIEEHENFLKYLEENSLDFKADAEGQSVEEIFPTYAKNVSTIIVYKLCKTMTIWLERYRTIL